MQDLDTQEVKLISGGTSNLGREIPPRYRKLIVALEDFSSSPAELLANREEQ
ncbi:MAG: hypothetical protein ACI9FB_002685 [Candidatus Azotimanducaceae bacterium]|jgi:hypothetical protein